MGVTIDGLEATLLSRLNVSELTEFCTQRPRNLSFTGLFRHWLCLHFADVSNIVDPLFKDPPLLWTASKETTQIVIESVGEFDPTIVEARPAILLARGDWDSQRLGIDDRSMPNWHPEGQPSASTQHAILWIGSHTIWCATRNYGQCERLAGEVADMLMEEAPIVRRVMGFHRLTVAKIGAPGKLKEAREHFAIPITLAYAHIVTWAISPEATRMRTAAMTITGE